MIGGVQETIAAGTGYFNIYVQIVPRENLSKKAELEMKAEEEDKKVSPVSRCYNPNGRAVDYHEQGKNVDFFA